MSAAAAQGSGMTSHIASESHAIANVGCVRESAYGHPPSPLPTQRVPSAQLPYPPLLRICTNSVTTLPQPART
jgi:hypothetical protein